ncbi:MAG: ABC transporter permease [Deltaproteobacteria bacterium]|nr:ABC transporter permease [Deltaproteobacteria bacterium]
MPIYRSVAIAAIAWKNVARKIFRNLILALAVSLLVALLSFALLFTKAVREDIDAATRRLGADIVIVPSEAKTMADEFILESVIKTFYMDDLVFDSVMDLPEIAAGTYQIYLHTLSSGCCSIDEGQVIAFNPDTDFVVTPWLKGAKQLNEGEVFIGSYVYDYLGLISTAKLFGSGVKIVGHLEETGTGLDRGIFMRIDDLNKISKEAMGEYAPGNISIIFLKVKEGADVDQVVAKIRKINPRIGIMTRGSIGADVRDTLQDILKIFSITIAISSILAILLAWSTFTAMTNERQREVGILRALGARRHHIVQMFLGEAFIISLAGGLLGIGLGHGLIIYLADDFNLLTRLGAHSVLTPANILLSGVAMLSGITVCLIGALAPVLRLARMEPLLAIKEE